MLNHLRGFAALAVCFYHFTCGNSTFLPAADVVRQVCSFGNLGVPVFFVISGFVLPYSLFARSFDWHHTKSFLIRRLKRIEPPYLACILIVVCLNELAARVPGYAGYPPKLSAESLLAHLAYLNAVLDLGWVNPVFWTLAIEFQFYLAIAVAFPFLASPRARTRLLSLSLFLSLSIFHGGNHSLLPYWAPLFALGIATFQLVAGHLTKPQYLLVTCMVLAAGLAVMSPDKVLAGVMTAAVIAAFGSREPSSLFRPFAMAGTISYSLYLLHVPVGSRLINLAVRLPDAPVYRYLAVCCALATSILCAAIFWRLIERPSHIWAKGNRSLSGNTTGIAPQLLKAPAAELLSTPDDCIESRSHAA